MPTPKNKHRLDIEQEERWRYDARQSHALKSKWTWLSLCVFLPVGLCILLFAMKFFSPESDQSYARVALDNEISLNIASLKEALAATQELSEDSRTPLVPQVRLNQEILRGSLIRYVQAFDPGDIKRRSALLLTGENVIETNGICLELARIHPSPGHTAWKKAVLTEEEAIDAYLREARDLREELAPKIRKNPSSRKFQLSAGEL